MRWGKLIDHDRCIGCHACSVACKQENGVPLGSFRTWVKYVEKGSFPEVRRHFAVLRCNQCDNAPCVQICPTAAMYRRPDGIVDFDGEQCIGCKGCIQACPYDAIYMDPDSQTAAKCHFCAHRIEVGLEPACVTACPERALLVGDMDNPLDEVARIVSREPVRVRKPELGTRPKVFYKGVDESTIIPQAAHRPKQSMWGQGRELPLFDAPGAAPKAATAGGGRAAAAIVAYDVPREESPWGWKISAYMITKGIGAGSLIVGSLLALATGTLPLLPAILAILFLGITSGLLVWDLRRPERFFKILLRPQWGSWLVRGTWCILAAVAVAFAWIAISQLSRTGPTPGEVKLCALLGIITGIGAAGYTAFLFGQARGRAFWQSTLLLPHLVVQAVASGAALLLVLVRLMFESSVVAMGSRDLGAILIGALVLDALAVISEVWSHVGPEDARLASRAITHGRLRDAFGFGVIGTRIVALAVLGAFLGMPVRTAGEIELALEVGTVGAALGLVGVAIWDHIFVLAGQEPPLS